MDSRRPPIEIPATPAEQTEVGAAPDVPTSGGESIPLIGDVVELGGGAQSDTLDVTRPADTRRVPSEPERHAENTDATEPGTAEYPSGAAPHEPPREDMPRPQDREATDARSEQAEADSQESAWIRRFKIGKEMVTEAGRKVFDRPVVQRVIDKLMAGETVRTEITRTERGGDVIFAGDDASKPPYATTAPIPEDVAREKGSFRTYVVLDCKKHAPKPPKEENGGSQETKPPEPEGMNVVGFLEQETEPFRMVMEGRPVPNSEVQRLRKFASRAYTDTKETEGMGGAAATYGSFLDEVDAAPDKAFAERRAVIGVKTDDPREAYRMARKYAASVFKGQDVTWAPRIDPETGMPVTYPTEEAALNAPDPPAPKSARGVQAPNMHKYVTGERYAEAVQYPATNVPGYEIRRHTPLAAERTVPDGVEAVKVARIVDNEGQRGKEMPVPEAHTLTVAETGAGKTELLHKKIEEVSVKNYELGRKCAVIVVDMEKSGNNLRVSERLSGRGLPESHATVNHIDLGSNDVRININPLRPVGDLTASDQLSVSATILGATLTDDARRVFTKFYKMAGDDILEQNGIDPESGKPRLPHGRFVAADPYMVANSMEKVINSSEFQEATKGDLGGFTLSQWRDFMRGAAAKTFLGGTDLDIDAMVRHSYETGEKMSVDLGSIRDPQAKQIAGTLLIEGINAACRKLKADLGITGDISERLCHLSIDEANAVYGADSPLASQMAASHKIARGDAGMVIDTYVQSPAGLHNDIVTNSPNTMALRVTHGPDRAVLAGRMAGVSIDELNDLITAIPGTGLHYGQYMGDKPVRFEVPNPKDAPRGPRYVNTTPEHVVDMGCDAEMYSPEVRVEARNFLKSELGVRMRAWVDMNVAWLSDGEPVASLTEIPDIPLDQELPEDYQPNLKEVLSDMGRTEGQVRDCALALAIKYSVVARSKELGWQGDPVDDYMKPLMDYSLPQVRGEAAPEFPDELRARLAVDAGRFNPVKADLNAVGVLTAPRLETSGRYERVLGRIGGMTADEQLDNVAKMEKKSVQGIALVVINNTVQETLAGSPDNPAVAANQDAVNRAIENVVGEYHKVVGRGGEEAKINLYQRVSQEKGQPLTPGDIKVLSAIIERAQETPPPVPPEEMVSYRDMDTALRESQATYQASGPIDLSKWEAIYSDLFDRDIKFSGSTAAEQLRSVELLDRRLQARSRQRGKVLERDIVMAPDLMSGGGASVIENVVTFFRNNGQPQDNASQRLRGLYPKSSDESLPGLIKASAEKAKRSGENMSDWVATLAQEVVYSSHINAHPAAIRSLVMKIFRARQDMERTAAQRAA